MKDTQQGKAKIYVNTITYAFALLALVLGLFLPVFNGSEILALKLGDAFKAIGNGENYFSHNYPMASFLCSGTYINLMALIAVLYLFVTVIAALGLIPVIVLRKKDKARNAFIYSIEIAALAVLSVFLFAAFTVKTDGTLFGTISVLAAQNALINEALGYNTAVSWNYLIPFIVIVIVLFIQSIYNKRATGGAKVALFVLSFIAVLALYNVALLFGAESLGSNLGITLGVASIKFGELNSVWQAIDSVTLLTDGGLKVFMDLFFANDTTAKAFIVLTLILGLLVLLNYFIDLISLSTNGKRVGLIFNVVRYTIVLCVILCLFITIPVGKYSLGLLLLVITLIAVAQLLISVIRLVMERRRAKNAKMHRDAPAQEQPAANGNVMYRTVPAGFQPVDPQIIPIYVQQPYVQPIVQQPYVPPVEEEVIDAEPYVVEVEKREETPAPPVNYVVERPAPQEYKNPYEPPVVTPKPAEPQVYTVNVYRGPVDDFMRKLSNEEKIEFSQVFIEKTKGDLGNVPDYTIGGDNKKFFSAIFIYLGRVRELVSDDLLNKMFKELNMM